MWKSDPQAWKDTFETNVTAQYFVAAGFLPLLAKARESTPGISPSIVNITSISGVMKGSSNGQFAYASSKAAFLHLTRMLATTFAEAKIRVNSIAPGVFPSEMTAGDSNEHQKSQLNSEASNPAGRFGADTDMGACILFLAGPGGVFLNGQVIYPDGGEFSSFHLRSAPSIARGCLRLQRASAQIGHIGNSQAHDHFLKESQMIILLLAMLLSLTVTPMLPFIHVYETRTCSADHSAGNILVQPACT
jgi:hypothetical protein